MYYSYVSSGGFWLGRQDYRKSHKEVDNLGHVDHIFRYKRCSKIYKNIVLSITKYSIHIVCGNND